MPSGEAFRHEQRRVALGMALALTITAFVLAAATFWEPAETPVMPVAERLQAALRTGLLVVP